MQKEKKQRLRAVIFGASTGGCRTLRYYRRHYDIIGFADNDPSKEDTHLLGLPVVGPARLDAFEFDCILIGSAYVGPITNQLLERGVDASRIGWVPWEIINGGHDLRWQTLVLLGMLLTAAFGGFCWGIP